MNKKYFHYHLLIIIVMISCSKIQKVEDFPKHDSKLVSNCIFSDSAAFQMSFSRSLSPLDNAAFRSLSNPNAYALIFKDGILFDSLYYDPNYKTNPNNGYAQPYRNPFFPNPTPGSFYELRTYYPGYPTLTASEYLPMPGSADIKDVQTIVESSFEFSDQFSKKYSISFSKNITLTLKDEGNGKDFYYLEFTNIFDSFTANAEKYGYISSIESRDIYNDITVLNNGENIIFVTENADAQTFKTINLTLKGIGVFREPKPLLHYKLIIKRCGKNAFNYLRSTSIARLNENDPFAEPTPTWNNIKNGFGVFGGYSYNSQIFIF